MRAEPAERDVRAECTIARRDAGVHPRPRSLRLQPGRGRSVGQDVPVRVGLARSGWRRADSARTSTPELEEHGGNVPGVPGTTSPVDSLEVTLPSGVRVRVSDSAPGEPPISDDRVEARRVFAGRMLRALSTGRLVVAVEGAPLAPGALDALALTDFHALRDAAYRIGVIDEDPDPDQRCRNCDTALAPGRLDAPIAELDQWYLEHPADPLEPPFPLGTEIRLANGKRAHTFDMEPVTVGRARPLWRALERSSVKITPRIVDALGIRALGDVRDRGAIAQALDRASDDAWAAVETAFVLLNYAPRSHYPYVCPECGALHDVLAPSTREFDADLDAEDLLLGGGEPSAAAGDDLAPFPDEDSFAEMALRIGSEVYAERRVKNIELVVDTGVPPVDGSGEPLMGSYRPMADGDAAGYTSLRFQIDVFYKTFEKMYADAPFDVEAELRETIDHEVEHHLHYLSGHDPMDEEERAEALTELERTYGKRAVRRARVTGVLGELRTIAWFVLAAVAVIALIALFAL